MALHVIGIFCEDIRDEKSGQVSIVGILPDNMHLPPPPDAIKSKEGFAAIIPKLGLYVRARYPLKGDLGPISVSLELADGTVLPLGEVGDDLVERSRKEAIENGLPLAGLVFHALLQGFQIAKPGLVTAVLQAGGERHVCAFLNTKAPTT